MDPSIATKFRVKCILNKHVPNLSDLKSPEEVKRIIDSITDIVQIIFHKKSGDIFRLIQDVSVVLTCLRELSFETREEILTDIFEYIVRILHMMS
jgi:hypothetical protein